MNYQSVPQSPSQRVAAEVRAEMARQNKRVTLTGMAEATGITLSTLRRRVDGSSSFTLDELTRVAEYLGVSVAVLSERARLVSEVPA